MAAWVLLLGILFTEVLEPICTTGVRAAGNSIIGKNGLKSDVKFGTNLIIRSNENLRIEPQGTLILGKKNLTINCISPTNKVFWLIDNEPVPPYDDLNCDILNNGSLHFPKKQNLNLVYKSKGSKVNVSKKYEIRCIGQSTSGGYLRSSPTFLQIADLSYSFKKNPNDLTVQEGGIARLSCLIEAIPFPPNITWQHNGQPIDRNNTKYFTIPPGVLYIIATQQSDAGSYRCIVNNGYIKKTKRSKEAKLTVTPNENNNSNKTFLYPQTFYNHSLIQGSNLTLVCAAFGYPLPLVKWTFISKNSDNADVSQSHILRNSTFGINILSLKNVSIDDAGTYLCSMENIPSNGVEIQNITIDVAVPPYFIKKPSNQICRNGRTVRFECQAYGYPTPRIYWLKDSARIIVHEGRKTTYFKEDNQVEFAVSATVLSDSGEYQCVAENTAGEIWAAGRLQVNAPKYSLVAPTSLRCIAISPYKIKLFWTPSASLPSSITAYTVHYKAAREKNVEEEKEEVLPVLKNVTSVEVTNLLEPNTNYSFYVRVWNKLEASDQSTNITCATLSSIPKSTPEISVKILSSTKLNVTWKPLAKKEARGNIIEYKVQWRPHDHPSMRTFSVPINVTHYILSDLIAGGHYDIRVLAKSTQGWPNIKNLHLNWTQVVMPKDISSPYKIKNNWDLYIFNINSSHLKMIWRAKSSKRIEEFNFDSWKIYYKSLKGDKVFNVDLEKNIKEYLFTNLEENISYIVGICINIDNQPIDCLSRIVKSIKYRTIELQAVPLSSSEIQLTWNVINETDINQFEVCYQPVISVDPKQSSCFNVTKTTVTINKLLPNNLYRFKVTSFQHSVANDDFSQSIDCATEEDVPSEPMEIQHFPNAAAVEVTWKQPKVSNGQIISYLVHFNSASEPVHSENITVSGNVTSVLLPQLQDDKKYYVTVQAATKVGYGRSSKPHLILPKEIKMPSSLDKQEPPVKPNLDQSLGIILGVGISIVFILLSLCSIYCRKKWENSRSLRESAKPFKNHILSRNGNVCCVDHSSTSNNLQTNNQNCNEVELAVLCPSSPTSANLPSDKGIISNGIEACAKEPLLLPWSVNEEKKDHHITETTEYKENDCSVSSKHSEPEMDLNETELTMIDDTVIESRNTSLNNNLGCSVSSPEGKIMPALIPLLETNG